MRRICWLILCLWVLAPSIQAQSPEYRQISDLNGLPCNEVYSIFFDRDGYMWLGTEIGAFRYDGQSFQAFLPDKAPGQALTGFTAVGESLYMFNFQGDVFEVQQDSLKHIFIPDSISNRHYPLLSEGPDGKLWINTNLGIFSFNKTDGSWMNLTPPELREEDFSFSKSISSRNQGIWFISHKSIVNFDAQGYHFYDVQFRDKDDQTLPKYIIESNETDAWICHILDGSLYHKKGNHFVPYEQPELNELLKGRKFTNLKYLNHKLYFMAYDGLIVYDLQSKKSEWLFQNIPVTDLELDPEGNYWMSTLGYGILYCTSFDVRTYPNNRMGGSSSKFTYLADDGKGGIFYS
ncbi:MAG: hypothetical protein LPK45_02295, partial [Bacteroidota bacterium]|nr:hypothetical protein [Bacteroidota bacterium]MDX5429863.1 hypothetical protein [Bacteroidota bacterium]MDX5468642.1 hypothetical protein [Bacteroidota bacterium]